jgi:hypothetical protein
MGRLIASRTTQPMLDAARVLVAEGDGSATRRFMRHEGIGWAFLPN